MIDCISREKAYQVISNAESVLEECFEMLLDFKHGGENIGKALTEFQPKLAESLYSLMQFYQELKAEKDLLISRKTSFDAAEFSRKMAFNAKLSQIVSKTISLGKNMGDAYAWFFYRDNRDELDKHFSHKPTGLFVAGIGGRGELEFIKNCTNIDGLFVLYHGITNILRIGDFSLYDSEHGIVGVGELKTIQVEDHLRVTANITSKVNIGPPSEAKSYTSDDFEASINTLQKSFPKIRKQLQAQDNLLKATEPGPSVSLMSSYEYDLINRLTPSSPVVINQDNSLMLVAGWSKYNALFDVLISDEDADGLPDNLVDLANQLFKPPSQYNEFILGKLNAQASLLSIPLLWWDINDNACHNIYFYKMCIETVFNPAKLLQFYIDDGFQISNFGKLDDIKINKTVGTQRVGVGNFSSICYLITNGLMATPYVYAFSKKITNAILSGTYPPNSKIDMHIHLNNFSPPPGVEVEDPVQKEIN